MVDAWYTLLDRWGTMTLRAGAGARHRDGRKRLPASTTAWPPPSPARKKLRKYPSSERVYFPGGKTWKAGEIATNPDLARTLKDWWKPSAPPRPRAAVPRSKPRRDRFYKGDIAREMAALLRRERRPVPLRGFRPLHSQNGGAGLRRLPRLHRAEEPLRGAGSGRAVRPQHPGNLRPPQASATTRPSTSTRRGGHETGLRRPRQVPRRHGFHPDSLRRAAVEGVRARPPQARSTTAKASLEYRPGVPEKYMGIAPLERPADINWAGDKGDGGDTSYLAVVDKDRNVVSFTPSLHTGFGTTVVMGDARLQLQLPRRLLLARAGPRQRARARQAPAQHPAIDPGVEGRRALPW